MLQSGGLFGPYTESMEFHLSAALSLCISKLAIVSSPDGCTDRAGMCAGHCTVYLLTGVFQILVCTELTALPPPDQLTGEAMKHPFHHATIIYFRAMPPPCQCSVYRKLQAGPGDNGKAVLAKGHGAELLCKLNTYIYGSLPAGGRTTEAKSDSVTSRNAHN